MIYTAFRNDAASGRILIYMLLAAKLLIRTIGPVYTISN
jgi:hypothetical protein